MIIHDIHNPRACEIAKELAERMPSGLSLPEDLRLVIGGDGFMLRTAFEGGTELTYLGLNAGHLGFLLNQIDDDWDHLIHALTHRLWKVVAFPLLKAELVFENGETGQLTAINDVYLERSSGQAAKLELQIDGHMVVEQLVADGLIFATALGSTAYSFSAGGQPVHPTLRTFQVTPICPHAPKLPPFSLHDSARATVRVIHPEWRPVRAVADGRSVEGVRSVEVYMSSESVRMAYLEPHDFTRQMLLKVVARG